MTIENPLFLQARTYSARQLRQFADVIFSEGVVNPGGGALAVTAVGGNNNVTVAVGKAVVTGDDQANQGKYLVNVSATETVTLSAAPGSNSRIDLIVLRIRDANAGGIAGDDAAIAVVEGTAAASPTVPATPASAIPLARVLRTAGDTAITGGMITDLRAASSTSTFTTTSNFLVVADAAARDALTGQYDGMTVYREDTDQVEVRKAGTWGPLATPVDIQTFTASGTWTKPAGAKIVEVVAIGGGGGSGGSNTNQSAGGGGGAYARAVVPASALAATESVTVGAGGSAGASTPTAGGAGGSSSFGTHVIAAGGGGGAARNAGSDYIYGGGGGGGPVAGATGTNEASSAAYALGGLAIHTAGSVLTERQRSGEGSAGGSSGNNNAAGGAYSGGGGGGGSYVTTNGSNGGKSIYGGGGGGGGSVAGNGAGTGGASSPNGGGTWPNGGGGAAGPSDHTAGTAGTSRSGTGFAGDGGGGGRGNAAGGAGGVPGGGAGGNGSGGTRAGLAGGRGEVIVVTYF